VPFWLSFFGPLFRPRVSSEVRTACLKIKKREPLITCERASVHRVLHAGQLRRFKREIRGRRDVFIHSQTQRGNSCRHMHSSQIKKGNLGEFAYIPCFRPFRGLGDGGRGSGDGCWRLSGGFAVKPAGQTEEQRKHMISMEYNGSK